MPAVQETGPRTAAASRRRAIDPTLGDPGPRLLRVALANPQGRLV